MRRSRRAYARGLLCTLLVSLVGHTEEVSTRSDRGPGQARVQAFAYDDDQGLEVLTLGAGFQQPVSPTLSLNAQGYFDQITIEREATHVHDPGAGATGHVHNDVDVVTSASVSVSGGGRLEKQRHEGNLGFAYQTAVSRAPLTLEGNLRASSEPDYRSYEAQVIADTELFQRNTTLSVFAGYGNDRVSPTEPPPGETGEWPATHQRVNAGITLGQLLGPELVLRGGLALNYQFGRLENPYRRALVRTSLFPESFPEQRFRGVAFVELSLYLGWETALHLRDTVYADDWGVLAFIPELVVAKDLTQRFTLAVAYRLYQQQAAKFYAVRYADLEPLRTGDIRLGSILAQRVGADAEWVILGSRAAEGSLVLRVEGALLRSDYRSLSSYQVAARVARLELGLTY